LEKLFALYNIKTVGFLDGSNVARMFAFTNKMLANNIFIEFFTVDESASEADLEETEDDDIEEVGIDEVDMHNEDIDEAEPEYGSRLSVIMKHKNKYYEFLMYHDTIEIGVPVMLLQTITFLVKLIDDSDPEKLIEYFTTLATDPLIPHEIPDKKFRNAANKMLKLKIQTIHDLIQEGKANLN
jgi:hypothetical protein